MIIGTGLLAGPQLAKSINTINGVVNVKDFGAVGDGVADDTAAVNAFFTACAGRVGDIGSGLTFLFSQMSIPANVTLRGDSIFRGNGSTVAGAQISIAGSFSAECLHVTTSGTETNYDLISFTGSNYEIGRIIAESDIERVGTGGINLGYTTGNFRCQHITTVNLARPFAAGGELGQAHTSNIHIGSLDATSHIRGVSIYNCRNWSLGSVRVVGKDSRAAKTPGHNGILIYAVKDFCIGRAWVEDSGEHAFRIGGSDGFGASSFTERGVIESFYSRNAGACGLKINPANTGCKNITVGEITVIDCGREGAATTGTPAGNEDGVRISDGQDIYIQSASIYAVAGANSSNHCVNLNGCTNVTFGNIYAEAPVGNVIRIDKNIDTVTGNFDGLFVHSLSGTSSSSPVVLVEYDDGARTVGNVMIRNMAIGGSYSHILSTTETISQSGLILVEGVCFGNSPNFNLQSGCTVTFDLFRQGSKFAGTATSGIGGGGNYTAFGAAAFDAAASVSSKGSVVIDASTQAAGLNNYAGSVAFSRAGSGRRGAAIAAKQTGSNSQQVGLALFTGNPATVGSDLVVENMLIHHDGNVFAGGGAITNVITGSGHLRLRSYTVATLPSASVEQQLIYVSDGASNKRIAVSDGTNWRFPDGNIVS
jgi:hypothetical protein